MESKHDADWKLVHLYLCKDEDAGRKLYQNAYTPLLKYVKSLSATYQFGFHDIDDVVAESLKRSVERLDRYDGSSSFTTWLIGIAYNVAREHKRKNSKTIALDEVSEVELNIPGDCYSKDPLRVVLNKELAEALVRSLGELSEDHRQIIQLRRLNKAPAKQVAEMLAESESAVNSRLIRALRSLRKIFERNY